MRDLAVPALIQDNSASMADKLSAMTNPVVRDPVSFILIGILHFTEAAFPGA